MPAQPAREQGVTAWFSQWNCSTTQQTHRTVTISHDASLEGSGLHAQHKHTLLLHAMAGRAPWLRTAGVLDGAHRVQVRIGAFKPVATAQCRARPGHQAVQTHAHT